MARWIPRPDYLKRTRALLRKFPAVCILGPRQCGKTTLARQGLDGFEYLDLELPSDFDKLTTSPELFLRSRKRPLIIDEAQRFPELFPILRALIDRNRKRAGRYLLLGSASFQLVESITESLSGRVAFVDLTPLLAGECARTAAQLDRHWLKGGFPDAFAQGRANQVESEWFEHHVRTLVERDLPALGIQLSPVQFRRLWQMSAHVHGNVLNMNKLAESMGLSPHTVRRYLDVLEQSFLVRRLPPFHANVKKRLVKSPKLYLRDSGLLHHFLRIADREGLLVSPERGKSFEGYVVEQILSRSKLETPRLEAFFLRTSDQYEADLVLTGGKTPVLIEVKAALSVERRDVERLQKCADLVGSERSYFLTLGEDRTPAAPGIQTIGIQHWRGSRYRAFWK